MLVLIAIPVLIILLIVRRAILHHQLKTDKSDNAALYREIGRLNKQVLDLMEEDKIVDHVNEIAPYLEEKLELLKEKYSFVTERRGKGLMQGLVCDIPVGPIIAKCLENGLVLINAGANIIRFVPPLIITKEHVDEMIEKLDQAMQVV